MFSGPTLFQNVPKETLFGDSSGLQIKPSGSGDENGLVSKALDQETTGSGDENELTGL